MGYLAGSVVLTVIIVLAVLSVLVVLVGIAKGAAPANYNGCFFLAEPTFGSVDANLRSPVARKSARSVTSGVAPLPLKVGALPAELPPACEALNLVRLAVGLHLVGRGAQKRPLDVVILHQRVQAAPPQAIWVAAHQLGQHAQPHAPPLTHRQDHFGHRLGVGQQVAADLGGVVQVVEQVAGFGKPAMRKAPSFSLTPSSTAPPWALAMAE